MRKEAHSEVNTDSAVKPGHVSLALVVLIAIIGLEIGYYPQISSWVFQAVTGHGWDGSALRYFQMYYVLPIGLVIAAALSTYVLWALRRDSTRSRRALVVAWVTNFLALALSILWYAKGTHA
jgi:hypothetical protein